MTQFIKRFQLDLRIWIGITGVIVAGIALLTLLGYAFGEERLYNWAGSIGMALNTAIEFVFVGLG